MLQKPFFFLGRQPPPDLALWLAHPVRPQRQLRVRDPRPLLRLPRHHIQDGHDIPQRRGHRRQGPRAGLAGQERGSGAGQGGKGGEVGHFFVGKEVRSNFDFEYNYLFIKARQLGRWPQKRIIVFAILVFCINCIRKNDNIPKMILFDMAIFRTI